MLSGMDRGELVDFMQFISYHGGEIGLVFHEAPTLTRRVSKAEAEALVDNYLRTRGTGSEVAVVQGGAVDKPKRATRGTRLPEGWRPAAPSVARIREQFPSVTSAELQYEHEKFTDFWNGKSGANATKLDWEGTWKNWMRRAFERRRGVPGAVAGNDQKIADLQSMKSGRG